MYFTNAIVSELQSTPTGRQSSFLELLLLQICYVFPDDTGTQPLILTMYVYP